MKHALFRSGHDLDPGLHFQNDLLRPNYGLFQASWQKQHVAGKVHAVPLLSQKLLQKGVFLKWIFLQFLLSGG